MFSKTVGVFFNDKKVGRITEFKLGHYDFTYDPEWLLNGFALDPVYLPLRKAVFTTQQISARLFNNPLFQIFHSSFFGIWHDLFIDLLLAEQEAPWQKISLLDKFLDKLVILADKGNGSLEYKLEEKYLDCRIDVERLISAHALILHKDAKDIDNLLKFWSLADTGPYFPFNTLIKFFVLTIDAEQWLLKYKQAGNTVEWENNQIAKKAGLYLPEIRLLEDRYLLSKRFDRRKDGSKIFCCRANIFLLRKMGCDYIDLLKLTSYLTKNQDEVVKIFRRMCLNIFLRCDDHLHNIAFLYDEGNWTVAPNYDLAQGPKPGHDTLLTVNHSYKPSTEDILITAKKVGISVQIAKDVLAEVKEAVNTYRKDGVL
jgi:serine/threonine-protein kinase HipA